MNIIVVLFAFLIQLRKATASETIDAVKATIQDKEGSDSDDQQNDDDEAVIILCFMVSYMISY